MRLEDLSSEQSSRILTLLQTFENEWVGVLRSNRECE